MTYYNTYQYFENWDRGFYAFLNFYRQISDLCYFLTDLHFDKKKLINLFSWTCSKNVTHCYTLCLVSHARRGLLHLQWYHVIFSSLIMSRHLLIGSSISVSNDLICVVIRTQGNVLVQYIIYQEIINSLEFTRRSKSPIQVRDTSCPVSFNCE